MSAIACEVEDDGGVFGRGVAELSSGGVLGDEVDIWADHCESAMEGVGACHGCFAGDDPYVSGVGDWTGDGFEALFVEGCECLVDGVFDGGADRGVGGVLVADAMAGACELACEFGPYPALEVGVAFESEFGGESDD